jgi:hypothetical protein
MPVSKRNGEGTRTNSLIPIGVQLEEDLNPVF